jgi:AraC-like DNA-binding protein
MKRPQLHKLPIAADASFIYHKWDCIYFDKPWHFHEEFELVYIKKGTGTRFIGNSVGHFQEGDLVLIGSNIPHLYRNTEEYYETGNLLNSSSIFIHFTRDFLGNQFFDIPEMSLVRTLLDKSSLALQIEGKAKKATIEKLNKMADQGQPMRLLSLLEMLITLSDSKDLRPLLSHGYLNTNTGDTKKINQVFEFILKNYKEEIYANQIASRLNMSTASFSRYFKKHTGKTVSDYITEIRIGNACRLLIENNLTISEICYQSGFENLSNFYKHFRKIIGVIPKEYRNTFLKNTL